MQNAKPNSKSGGRPRFGKFKVKEPETLTGWLQMLFAVYRIPVMLEPVTGYVLALRDLKAEELRLAFTETLREHKSSFPPTPGEIREYLQVAQERNPQAQKNPHANCATCGGTGWLTVGLKGYRMAVPCREAKKTAALP